METLSTNAPRPSEVEILKDLGPRLQIIESIMKKSAEQVMRDFPDPVGSYDEMMQQAIRVPTAWFLYLAGAMDYMLTRYKLLEGDANGTTEQPN